MTRLVWTVAAGLCWCGPLDSVDLNLATQRVGGGGEGLGTLASGNTRAMAKASHHLMMAIAALLIMNI